MASRGTKKKAKEGGRIVQHVSPVEGADAEQYFCRKKFLEIFEAECPEAREELRDSVWPEYKGMLERIEASSLGPALPTTDSRDVLSTFQAFSAWLAQTRSDPAVTGFARTLDEWVAKYHLEADWLRDSALQTILAYGPKFPVELS